MSDCGVKEIVLVYGTGGEMFDMGKINCNVLFSKCSPHSIKNDDPPLLYISIDSMSFCFQFN